MKQAVDLLLSQSIAGGIVIAAVLLIRAVLLRRASARWVYALWLVAAIRLLLPLQWPVWPSTQIGPALSPETIAIALAFRRKFACCKRKFRTFISARGGKGFFSASIGSARRVPPCPRTVMEGSGILPVACGRTGYGGIYRQGKRALLYAARAQCCAHERAWLHPRLPLLRGFALSFGLFPTAHLRK